MTDGHQKRNQSTSLSTFRNLSESIRKAINHIGDIQVGDEGRYFVRPSMVDDTTKKTKNILINRLSSRGLVEVKIDNANRIAVITLKMMKNVSVDKDHRPQDTKERHIILARSRSNLHDRYPQDLDHAQKICQDCIVAQLDDEESRKVLEGAVADCKPNISLGSYYGPGSPDSKIFDLMSKYISFVVYTGDKKKSPFFAARADQDQAYRKGMKVLSSHPNKSLSRWGYTLPFRNVEFFHGNTLTGEAFQEFKKLLKWKSDVIYQRFFKSLER